MFVEGALTLPCHSFAVGKVTVVVRVQGAPPRLISSWCESDTRGARCGELDCSESVLRTTHRLFNTGVICPAASVVKHWNVYARHACGLAMLPKPHSMTSKQTPHRITSPF